MKTETVRLGYEIPDGEPVEIPIAHMCVTGQTQLSGKTTTLEALISRSGRKAIAFVTKRGEGAFQNGVGWPYKNSPDFLVKPHQPFFRHRADWQFVSDILGAILSEKLKFQRPWIMTVCKSAKSLDQVRDNVRSRLAGDKIRKIRPATGLAQSIYTELEEYFELLIPEIERLPYTDSLELAPGLNVMDLSEYSTALQMLVIAAVLEEIYKKYKGVVVVIPEAWEFVPNGKSSPVKSAAITLARKGAALQNFIWLDSQDLASIDTEVRRACSVWILGVQREQNEVKRLLAHIPNVPAPKVKDIMHLEKGQFFACYGLELHKVYVQPAWMGDDLAQLVATSDTRGVPDRDLQAPVPPKGIATLINGDEHTSIMADVAVGDPIGDIDSREKIGFSSVPIHLDPAHPLDTITLARPSDLPPIDKSHYNTMPPGAPYFIDDGGKTVDQQEREGYERTIQLLKEQIKQLQTPPYDPRADVSTAFTREEATRGPCDAPSHEGFTPERLAKLVDLVTVEVLKRVPANGRVVLEPAEYVLKRFQQDEVSRILAAAEARSVFQKQAIKFVEAKGKGTRTGDLVTAVTGKRSKNMSRDCKVEYDELAELATMGFMRYDQHNGLYHPNLGVVIKQRLAQFDPSVDDIDQIVGQVILKLN